jgi:RNA polymerase primary sigma factor
MPSRNADAGRSLSQYLDEIDRYEILTAEEELALCRKAVWGEVVARNQLVASHLRFVVQVAKKYRGRGLSFQDLIEEGNLGLIQATRRFDPDRGFRFLSYAVWWIRQSIVQSLMENGRLVRLPAYRLKRIRKARKVFAELRTSLGRDPLDDEVAAAMEISVADLRHDETVSQLHLSLDSEMAVGEEGRTFKDLIPDEETLRPDALCRDTLRAERLAHALRGLPERQQRVLMLYFGLGGQRRHTLEEIGRSYGFTRENARQIKQKGLRAMRTVLETDQRLAAVG